MNCPWCTFKFGALATNADTLPICAPLICENCGAISLLAEGEIRKTTAAEMALIRDSPAWHEVLEPVARLIMETKVPPADRANISMSDGTPIVPGYRELRPDGMQKGYVVLSDAERQKGFVRSYRDAYTHLVCGSDTTMGWRIAETYARDPKFYGGTYCCSCMKHYPLDEFVWKGTNEKVGS